MSSWTFAHRLLLPSLRYTQIARDFFIYVLTFDRYVHVIYLRNYPLFCIAIGVYFPLAVTIRSRVFRFAH